MIDLRTFRRDAPLKSYLAGLLGTGLIAAVAGGVVGFAGNAGWLGVAVAAGVTALAFAGAAAICLIWWRGIDEAAREAHKWAWWWGGTAGTVIGAFALIGLMFVAGSDGHLLGQLSSMTPIDAARLSVMTILLCQMGGYGVAWAVWWLARR